MFAIAVRLLAVSAARAVVFDIGGVLEVPVDTHLDDLEANVAAARGVGMRAVLFQTTAQAITDVEACLAHSTG